MFERRLKIFLSILLLVTGVMILRAMQLQVLGRDHWRQQAVDSMKRPRLLETTRGTILDAKNVPIAIDEACEDAAVDYRAILEPPDPAWVKAQAAARVRAELGDAYFKTSAEERNQRIGHATAAVMDGIDQMWKALAKESGQSLEQIDDTRRAIVERVQMRRRYVWYQRYRKAADEKKGETAPWYSRWLIESEAQGPDLDNFFEDVGEQEAAHPILHDISNETRISLKKSRHKYPGLTFIDSTDRRYPYDNVAAHVLGRLSKVMQEDIERDPNLGRDELREYQKNDLIGRTGLEALCEPALRGTRGQVVRVAGETTEMSRIEAVPGANVHTTLDIKLQHDIEALFKSVQIRNHDLSIETIEMHGAAVVIDVPSGAVRALASWPNYDANRFDEDYTVLADNFIDQPLLNRATQWAIEPGSTVKPIVGLGAIHDGHVRCTEGIECTGYLMVNNKPFRSGHRCWVAKQYAASLGDEGIKHHRIPSNAPHRGRDGNPDGFLTFSDALERSCNVYFATLAGKMGMAGVNRWFGHFGLGRRTGVGIAESNGWLPDVDHLSRRVIPGHTWNAGIGQGQVGATTIQMANVSATLARGGVWLRPHLVAQGTPTAPPQSLRVEGPDRVDLKLPPDALAAAKEGMLNVVYSLGGTAAMDMRRDVMVAGKTGSATAAAFRTPKRNEKGVVLRDERGRVLEWEAYRPVSPQNPNGFPRWYRGFGPDGTTLSHAWFTGYAPADNPQVAFAVMVEYGGSGGFAAVSVANGLIEACLKHGYLKAGAPWSTAAAPTAAAQ